MTEPVTLDIAEMLPATFTAPSMTEAEFVDLCQKFPDASLEYTPDGDFDHHAADRSRKREA
ncbi:MAG: hypothetical protein WDN31_11060 [Hyphomicrobium sp.]